MPVVQPGEAQVWDALGKIMDPEIPVVSMVEMGIVREVSVEEGGVTVTMTPTFSGCPALHVMRENIELKLREMGFEDIEIKTVLSPAWSTDWMTSEAKEKLKRYGITPPAPADDDGLIQLELSPTPCPRCDSFNTVTKNSFGPTLCKSIHYCNSCQEPFEAFKSI